LLSALHKKYDTVVTQSLRSGLSPSRSCRLHHLL